MLYQLSTSYGCSLCQPHGLQSSCFEVNTQIIKIIQKNLRFCSIAITLNKKTNDENRIIIEQEIILIPQVAPSLPAPLHHSRSSIVCLVLMVRLVTVKKYLTHIHRNDQQLLFMKISKFLRWKNLLLMVSKNKANLFSVQMRKEGSTKELCEV